MGDYVNDSFYQKYKELDGDRFSSYQEFCKEAWNGAFSDYKWLEHSFTQIQRMHREGVKSYDYCVRNTVMPEASSLDELITDIQRSEFKTPSGKIFLSVKMKNGEQNYYGSCSITAKARAKWNEIYGYPLSGIELIQWRYDEGNYFLVIFNPANMVGNGWMALVKDEGQFAGEK